ncbi:MAG: CpaF family protein [Anaerolineae bacterium]|nr:CpaF family protein [Anaerolineae bacterium]
MEIQDVLAALGPLVPLYTDADVLEIMVDAPDSVYVERCGKLERTQVQFESPDALRAVIDALLALDGIVLLPEHPIGEMRFPDDARLLAVIPPTALNGPTFVIRKSAPQRMTWERLFEYGAATPEVRDFLQMAINARVNILVAGGPGSGKTTIANMLAEMIPANQRLIVVEETHELRFDRPHRVWLEGGGPAALPLTTLLDTAARMRPDWLIVGELHGAEAMRALQVMSTGYNAITTIHATSPEDALSRLETYCLMANLGLGLAEIRRLIASAVQLITYQERLPNGRRKIMRLLEVAGLESDLRYNLKPLFRFDADRGTLERTGELPLWDQILATV